MFAESVVQLEPQSSLPEDGPTILVVDDDPTQAESLAFRLRQHGFSPTMAATGRQALALAHSDQPAAVLLDLQLPDVDGLSVCEQLVDSPDTCEIPVIIVSGVDRPDVLRQARAAGCHYYLRKPYDPSALLILLRQALQEMNDF